MIHSIRITLSIIAVSLSLTIFARNTYSSPEDYEKLWKQVEAFNNDALPKSALIIVDQIYDLAIADNNEKQIIKAIVHKKGYTKILVEEGGKQTISQLESEINQYSGIVKPFMHLFLATMYEEYHSLNAYSISQRSVTSNFDNNDIATWNETMFKDKIIKNYLLALDDVLKNENLSDYSEFIQEAAESQACFPTLYDFVAYHAITHLSAETRYYYYADNE